MIDMARKQFLPAIIKSPTGKPTHLNIPQLGDMPRPEGGRGTPVI